MLRLIFLTFLLFQFSLSCISQTDVVSAGGNATGANGKVSFSVGQTLYSNYASSSGNENHAYNSFSGLGKSFEKVF